MHTEQDDEKTAFDLACRYILQVQPAAVAVVYATLDCKCVKMSGVDSSGNILNPMTLVLGPEAQGRDRRPRCRTCESDRGLDLSRLEHHGMVWPDRETRRKEAYRRQIIGRKIFGAAYPKNSTDLVLSGHKTEVADPSKTGPDFNPVSTAWQPSASSPTGSRGRRSGRSY